MKQRDKKSNRKQIRNLLILGAVLILAATGLFLPGRVLAIQEEQEYDQVSSVPEEYMSSSSAMARSASSNLKNVERLQLIAGQWESDDQTAKSYEMEQEDYEAVSLAKTNMKALYDSGQYPMELASEYSNWYSWTAQARKAVDTTFHTYTAYYWVIHLKKYDGSEQHTIWMLDDGTIFFAEAVTQEEIDLTHVKELDATAEQDANGDTITNLDTEKESIAERITYPEIHTDGLSWKGLAQVTEDEDIYYVLQLYGEKRYLFLITP